MAKLANRMDVQMSPGNLKPSDPIAVLSILCTVRAACDINGIREGASKWISQHFMKNTFEAALAHRVHVMKENDAQQERWLATYFPVVFISLYV